MMAKIDLPAPGGIALFYAKSESFGVDTTEWGHHFGCPWAGRA